MNDLIDSSVLVAAMVQSELHHEACAGLLDQGGLCLYAHGISETFNTLTGGRLPVRLPASFACQLLEEDYLPGLKIVSLTPRDQLAALREAESRGVRGAAIFDYLHLIAARKVRAPRIHTLNLSHFRAFRREGDPEIVSPSQ